MNGFANGVFYAALSALAHCATLGPTFSSLSFSISFILFFISCVSIEMIRQSHISALKDRIHNGHDRDGDFESEIYKESKMRRRGSVTHPVV